MRSMLIPLAVIVVLLANGCSSSFMPPQTYQFDKERVYALTYGAVLKKVSSWFESKEIQIARGDTVPGLLSATYKLNPDQFNPEAEGYICDCGKPAVSMSEAQKIKYATAAISVMVRIVDDQHTKVSMNIQYQADLYLNEYGSETMGDSYLHKLECNSTGRLEKELLDYVGQ